MQDADKSPPQKQIHLNITAVSKNPWCPNGQYSHLKNRQNSIIKCIIIFFRLPAFVNDPIISFI